MEIDNISGGKNPLCLSVSRVHYHSQPALQQKIADHFLYHITLEFLARYRQKKLEIEKTVGTGSYLWLSTAKTGRWYGGQNLSFETSSRCSLGVCSS